MEVSKSKQGITSYIEFDNPSSAVPISKNFMQLDDSFLFFLAEVASLYIWPQVVYPSESATLATSL